MTIFSYLRENQTIDAFPFCYQLWQQQPEVLAPVIGDGLLGGSKRHSSLADHLLPVIVWLRLIVSSNQIFLLSAAAPGIKALIPAAAGVVLSQNAQVYQPVIITQPAIQVSSILTRHLYCRQVSL